ATIVRTHSGRLPTSVRTTSPRCTPCTWSTPASSAADRETSPKRHSRRDPSRASSMSASRSAGAASTTSRAKFTAWDAIDALGDLPLVAELGHLQDQRGLDPRHARELAQLGRDEVEQMLVVVEERLDDQLVAPRGEA